MSAPTITDLHEAANEPRLIAVCAICGYSITSPTRCSYRGDLVHESCFTGTRRYRNGRRFRLVSPRGRRLRRLVPPNERTKPWLRKEYGVRKVRGEWKEPTG